MLPDAAAFRDEKRAILRLPSYEGTYCRGRSNASRTGVVARTFVPLDASRPPTAKTCPPGCDVPDFTRSAQRATAANDRNDEGRDP